MVVTYDHPPDPSVLRAERIKFDQTRPWKKRIHAGALAGTNLGAFFTDFVRANPQVKTMPGFSAAEKISHYGLDRGQSKYPQAADSVVFDIPQKDTFGDGFTTIWNFVYAALPQSSGQVNLPVGYSIQPNGMLHTVWMAIQSG